jgi:type II secretory pathway pseudopilin PulG
MDEFSLWLVKNAPIAILLPVAVAIIGAVSAIVVSSVSWSSARGAAKLANEAIRESARTAALVAEKNSERKILIENITQERAKWREKIRTKSMEAHKAAIQRNTIWLAELKLSFATSLNPTDHEDDLILNLIDKLKDEKDRETKLEEFSDRISLLLKHDWERAKNEAESAKKIVVKRLTLEQLRSKRAAHREKRGTTLIAQNDQQAQEI